MGRTPENSSGRIVSEPSTITRRKALFVIAGATAGALFSADKPPVKYTPPARASEASLTLTPPKDPLPAVNQPTHPASLQEKAPDRLQIQRLETAHNLALNINMLAHDDKIQEKLTSRPNTEKVDGKQVGGKDVLTFWTNRGSENLETRTGISIDNYADGSTRQLLIYLANVSESHDVHASVRLDLDFTGDEATATVTGYDAKTGNQKVVFGTNAYDGKTRPLPLDDTGFTRFDHIRELVSAVIVGGQAVTNIEINSALWDLTNEY